VQGLDIPRLDTLVLASPKTGVEQAVGRILRPGGDKQAPLVVDVVDDFSAFANMAKARSRFYRKHGYRCGQLSSTGELHEQGQAATWAAEELAAQSDQ
jgi:superfamily II DNA or RNA helicase